MRKASTAVKTANFSLRMIITAAAAKRRGCVSRRKTVARRNMPVYGKVVGYKRTGAADNIFYAKLTEQQSQNHCTKHYNSRCPCLFEKAERKSEYNPDKTFFAEKAHYSHKCIKKITFYALY